MEEILSIKSNALELLDKQLHTKAKKGQHGFIVLSSSTDPYLQFEKDTGLTREILKVILNYKFPVHIINKSDLVVRDFDLLEQINQEAILPEDLKDKLSQKALITFSFSTLDEAVAQIFEPGATLPGKRLSTLKAVLQQGFMSGVSMMPLLPWITDTGQNLEFMFSKFKQAGAKYIMPASLTLFGNGVSDSKTLMLKAVAKHFPELLPKYEKFFSGSTEMPSYYTQALTKKTKELCKKYKLNDRII